MRLIMVSVYNFVSCAYIFLGLEDTYYVDRNQLNIFEILQHDLHNPESGA